MREAGQVMRVTFAARSVGVDNRVGKNRGLVRLRNVHKLLLQEDHDTYCGTVTEN